MAGLARVHWIIAGRRVPMADWTCNDNAMGGFDQMRGIIASEDASPLRGVVQGASVQGWTEYGRTLFEGRLAAAPKLSQDGKASIVAQGHSIEAAKRQSELLLYSSSGSSFRDASVAPFFQGTSAMTISVVEGNTVEVNNDPNTIGKGAMSLTSAETGTNFTTGLYIPQGRISRFKAFWDSTSVTVHDIAIATGPTGAPIPIWRGNSVGSGVIDLTFDPSDTLFIRYHGASIPPNSTWAALYGIEIWGDVPTDVIYSEQVARAVADRLAWDTSGIEAVGAGDVRPIDWHGPWDQLLNYVAGLEDANWGVRENEWGYGAREDYGAWGRRAWEVSSSGAVWDLQPLEIFNRVSVAYVSMDGKDQEVALDADPDPLDGIVNEAKVSMNDRQADYGLPLTYAQRTLEHISTQLYSGRITLVSATDVSSGLDAPYEIRGGDLLTIRDFNGSEALTIRVADVEYSPDSVSVGVEEPAVPVANFMVGSGAQMAGPQQNPGTATDDRFVSQPTQSQREPYFNRHWRLTN